MKETNNIAIALDALGEKIASLESQVAYEQLMKAELEKKVSEREQRIMMLEERLAAYLKADAMRTEGL